MCLQCNGRRMRRSLSAGTLCLQAVSAPLILTSPAADAQSCGALTRGLLAVWHAGATAAPGDWRSHVLSRALQANPAAAQPLLLGVLGLLARATASKDGVPASDTSGGNFSSTLAAVRPFLAFVLLSPEVAAQQPGLAAEAHASLARFACCTCSAEAQREVLALLLALLPARQARTPAQQGAAVAAVADILDLVESYEEEPGGCCGSRARCRGVGSCLVFA